MGTRGSGRRRPDRAPNTPAPQHQQLRSSNGNVKDGRVDADCGMPIEFSMTVSSTDRANSPVRMYETACKYVQDWAERGACSYDLQDWAGGKREPPRAGRHDDADQEYLHRRCQAQRSFENRFSREHGNQVCRPRETDIRGHLTFQGLSATAVNTRDAPTQDYAKRGNEDRDIHHPQGLSASEARDGPRASYRARQDDLAGPAPVQERELPLPRCVSAVLRCVACPGY